jgi:hypothetical protein
MNNVRSNIRLAAAIVFSLSGPCIAADDADKAALKPQVPSKRHFTAEEKAEKQARKACKIGICDILATKEQIGPDVACDIVKTWRADDIVNMLSGRIDWLWGKAVCQSKLKLDRAPLAKAMGESRQKIVMKTHTVRCTLHQKQDKLTLSRSTWLQR